MRKNFRPGAVLGAGTGQFRVRIVVLLLALFNLAALYLYIYPPGGSQRELAAQDQDIKAQAAAMNAQGSKIKMMATRVESGSNQISEFEKSYFLPKRIAYGSVIEEVQRMAKTAGLQERDAGFSEEPIEGTADLSLLNIKANYEGSYASLMRFLYETDKSPMLLMLDSLTATPEQKNGQISADIRFQAVIQDQGSSPTAIRQPIAGVHP
jgi:hypothetical protein